MNKSAVAVEPRHRVFPEKADRMAHADVRKAENSDLWPALGACLDFARREQGWTLDQLAGFLPPPKGAESRDPRQVARWIRGEEPMQIAVVFAVKELQAGFVVALSRLTNEFEEELTLIRRRRA